MDTMNYEQKYLKYKTKYELAKKKRINNLKGGMLNEEFTKLMTEARNSLPDIQIIARLQEKINLYFDQINILNDLLGQKEVELDAKSAEIQDLSGKIQALEAITSKIPDATAAAELQDLKQVKQQLTANIAQITTERDLLDAQLQEAAAFIQTVIRENSSLKDLSAKADARLEELKGLEPPPVEGFATKLD